MLDAIVTIGIPPTFEVGPLTLSWHGLTIAIGILAGGWLATVYGRERGLDPEQIVNLVIVIGISGIVGARALYLIENDAAALLNPADWLGNEGFSFYGAMLVGIPAAWLYARSQGLGLRYLDALGAGFPLGMALGRIGDVINGEHYGPVSDLPWAFRYTDPAADVPSNDLAYHSGGFYEVLLGLAILAVIWPLRDRFRAPGTLLCAAVALYAVGRFAMFFVRSDSENLALGLVAAQWTSLGLLVAAGVAGLWLTRLAGDEPERAERPVMSGSGSR